jgi:hypothetical protein
MRQHSLEILHYVRVRYTDKAEALAKKPSRPMLIIRLLAGMSIAVHFHDQPGLAAEKIGDEAAEPDLATKFEAI